MSPELTTFISSLYLILALVIIVIIVLTLVGFLKTRVPFVPVPKKLIPLIIQKLELTEHSIFYDLGCGDGRIIIAAGEKNPTIVAIGVEKAPLPYLLSQCALFFSKQKNSNVLFKDFTNIDLRNASHIFMYLLPETIEKLLPKLEKELKANTRAVLCDFAFKNRIPVEKTVSEKGLRKHTLYVYNF